MNEMAIWAPKLDTVDCICVRTSKPPPNPIPHPYIVQLWYVGLACRVEAELNIVVSAVIVQAPVFYIQPIPAFSNVFICDRWEGSNHLDVIGWVKPVRMIDGPVLTMFSSELSTYPSQHVWIQAQK